MPVSSPVFGSRTMQLGLAKPSGEIGLSTSTIGSLAAIAFFTASGRSRLTRIGPTPETSTRGWWKAASTSMPRSICISASWATAGTMRRPPDAPMQNHALPSFATTTGQMLQSGFLPGAIELGLLGSGSNHSMPLFMVMPVLGSMTLEPNRLIRVCVSATMLPSESAAQKCVVQVLVGLSPSVFSRSS